MATGFRMWRDDGTWQRIHDTLRAHVRRRAGRQKHPTAGCLDSQSVKATSRAIALAFLCDSNIGGDILRRLSIFYAVVIYEPARA